MEVSNDLGAGFPESVHHRALLQEPSKPGIQARSECARQIFHKGAPVGDYVADLIVKDRLTLELKALPAFTPAHEAQHLNYLKGTGLRVGLLVNFGIPKIH